MIARRTITFDERSSNLISMGHPVHTRTLNSHRKSGIPLQGHGYILQLVMKTLHGKSSELPTTPYLSLHLKYTINMLRRRPEIAEHHALRRQSFSSFSPLPSSSPSCQFLQPLSRQGKRERRDRGLTRAFHFYYRGAR